VKKALLLLCLLAAITPEVKSMECLKKVAVFLKKACCCCPRVVRVQALPQVVHQVAQPAPRIAIPQIHIHANRVRAYTEHNPRLWPAMIRAANNHPNPAIKERVVSIISEF